MKVATFLLVAVSVLAHNITALTIEKRDGPNDLTPVPIEESNEGSVTCNECLKDAGICCAVECQSDGHCPSDTIANAGWLIGGVKITSNLRKEKH
ncbi:hypothetical protein PV04_10784 [Phialophora macrospora]|uniref:4Fe-4S ferredoxin-type domain-containing protein n=1 Tax=Phialophora macrospora TaxID=1851006 RepID=A0A0D2DJS6_9EURO|nr:hypothetical protein PV04_10784 [Phialophora macrospora]